MNVYIHTHRHTHTDTHTKTHTDTHTQTHTNTPFLLEGHKVGNDNLEALAIPDLICHNSLFVTKSYKFCTLSVANSKHGHSAHHCRQEMSRTCKFWSGVCGRPKHVSPQHDTWPTFCQETSVSTHFSARGVDKSDKSRTGAFALNSDQIARRRSSPPQFATTRRPHTLSSMHCNSFAVFTNDIYRRRWNVVPRLARASHTLFI